MEKGNIDDFLAALFAREAGKKTNIMNYAGYLGKYQFGESALIDLGYYSPDGTSNNDWTGTWKGKNGIGSRQQFLARTDVQDLAAREWVALLCKRMRKLGLDAYIGKTINGINITDSGIIAGAHLKGFGSSEHPGVKKFLSSNGEVDPKDGLGTPVSHYVSLFAGYDVGCCQKVSLSFAEKSTGSAISGLNVQVCRNGKLHTAATTDENGCIASVHGFKSGDLVEVLVEKITSGFKKISQEIVGDSHLRLVFFSPKVKAVSQTDVHQGDPHPPQKSHNKSATNKSEPDLLDRLSQAWSDLTANKAQSEPSMARNPSADANSTRDHKPIARPKASTGKHGAAKTEKTRSAKGHPKTVVKKPPAQPPTQVSAPMQKTIPNLLFPLENKPAQSYKEGARRFGTNRDGGKRKHAGIDLYAPVGSPIRAMADGVVIQTYPFYLGTNAVEIDHGGFVARYGEVQPKTILVKANQEVKRGQIIAHVGKLSGLQFSMLHLEMYGTNESPLSTGLTQTGKPPFQRRSDLIDPTSSIDQADME